MTGVASTAAGVLASLIANGLSRAGSLSFQKLRRLRRIDAAFKSKKLLHGPLRKAVSDFEIVIGSYHGELTENLFDFLREFESSGLIVTITEEILLGYESEQSALAFQALYQQYFKGADSDGRELYNKIRSSFEITFMELKNDDVMVPALRALHSTITARLDSIAESYRANSQQLERINFNAVDDKDLLARISRGIKSKFYSLKIETTKGVRSVEISRLYVPARLLPRDHVIHTGRPNFSYRMKASYESTEDHASTLALFPLSYDEKGIQYKDFKTSFRKAVILGDPGGGKSTLCRALCYELARKSVAAATQSSKISAQTLVQDHKIPLFIELRKFEGARTQESQLDIFEYIRRELKNLIGGDDDNIANCLRYLLLHGRSILFFDGLDEILETSRRQEYVDLVSTFSDQYPQCPVLVTSRIVGYEDAPLPGDFETLLLDKLDNADIETYVEKFMRQVLSIGSEEAKVQRDEFVRQTRQHGGDLRRNPLLLGLMVWLFYAQGNVPENLPEIYKECAILMFEKWDEKRGIKTDIPDDFDLLGLFSYLAHEIYGNAELSEGVTGEWLLEISRKFFESQYEDRPRALAAAKAVRRFIVGRAWVMSEVGDNVFRFTHRTFLEYFVARKIYEECDTVAQLLRRIRPFIVRRQRDVVSHLALQLMTFRNHRKTEEALEELGALITPKRRSRQREACLDFAAQALSYLPAGESKIREIVTEICTETLNLESGRLRRDGYVPIVKCTRVVRSRRQVANDAISRSLASVVVSNDDDARRAAVYAISVGLTGMQIFSPQEIELMSETNEAICFGPRRLIKKYVIGQSRSNKEMARMSWDWYPEERWRVISKFGLGIFVGRAPFNSSDILTTLESMLLQVGKKMYWFSDFLTPGDREKEVEVIGRYIIDRAPVSIDRTWIRKAQSVEWDRELLSLRLAEVVTDRELFRSTLAIVMLIADIHESMKGWKGGRRERKATLNKAIIEDSQMFQSLLSAMDRLEPRVRHKEFAFADAWMGGAPLCEIATQ